MTGGGQRGGRVRRLRPTSIRNRLVLLFFAITAAAIGIVYLYVVPQLESSLVAEKLRRLEQTVATQDDSLRSALARKAPPGELNPLVERIGQESGARLTLLGVAEQGGELAPAFVIADSQAEPGATLLRYEVVAAAARSGGVRSGTETIAGERTGQTAILLSDRGRPGWAAVFSIPLADVEGTVGLIRRQILIAGWIALAAALLAGWWAAQAISRRLRRLEQAAQKVAGGQFTVPIPVDSADELGQLATTFNEMQSRLARLDDARKEFIANASHELRTPIFSLGGFVELLQDEELDSATREDFVQTMGEQIERLTKLTTDLLDLSKLDAGALEIRPGSVDVGRLAEAIAAEFGAAAARHGSPLEVRSTGDGPVAAMADPDRVAQIIRILLDNALTHTPEGTPITVTTLRQNGVAEVIVTDEGPGIDRRSLAQIFDRFYTGASGRGSGLGLAVARELAIRMNGRLDVASKAGFTAFTLELPVSARIQGESG